MVSGEGCAIRLYRVPIIAVPSTFNITEPGIFISSVLFNSVDYMSRLMTNIKSEMRSFKSNENIHKKEGGSYYVVSANKASTVTLQSPGNESQRKRTAILRISNRQSIQRLI